MLSAQLPEGLVSVLNTAIGMKNQAVMNAASVQCHSEGGNGGFVRFHGATERPSHDFTPPQIHDDGQIHPTVPDSDIGQIADPDLIRPCGIEVAFDMIPSNGVRVTGVGRGFVGTALQGFYAPANSSTARRNVRIH